MSRSFTVEVLINAKNNAGAVFSQFKKGFGDALGIPASWGDAANMLGSALGNVVRQLPQLVMETAKLGIQSEAMTRRFTAFAGSTDRASEFLDAFQKASDGTIDRLSAMEGATKLLGMGLVDNADEMETMVAIAVKMGDQTMSAGDRIRDFAMLLANQSTPRLDNFNISSGKARKLIDELLKSGQAISREQAFKMAVMQEGARSLEILGDTSELAATKMARLQAAVKDAQLDFGEMIVEFVSGAGDTDELAQRIRGLRETVKQTSFVIEHGARWWRGFMQSLGDTTEAAERAREEMKHHPKVIEAILEAHGKWQGDEENTRWEIEQTQIALAEQQKALEIEAAKLSEVSFLTDEASVSFRDFGGTQEETMFAVLLASEAIEAERLALAAETLAAQNARIAHLDLAQTLMDATAAQIAMVAIQQLKQALDEGTITFDEYNIAVTQTQLAFGLATPESQALAVNIGALTTALENGDIRATDFNEALAVLQAQAEAGTIKANALGAAIRAIPSRKVITIETRMSQIVARGGGFQEAQFGGIARGGPVLVGEGGPEFVFPPAGSRITPINRSTTNQFNMTVNTRATTPSVTQDFQLMQAMMQ